MHAGLSLLLRFVTAIVMAAFLGSAGARQTQEPFEYVALSTLPLEAQRTLQRIHQGGPFPYPRKDGSSFGNFEKRLPFQPRGYYREYTVPTPAAHDRGARRIIAGSPPETSGEYYYTDDHYRSFRRIKE